MSKPTMWSAATILSKEVPLTLEWTGSGRTFLDTEGIPKETKPVLVRGKR